MQTTLSISLTISGALLMSALSSAFAVRGEPVDISRLHDSVKISLGQKVAIAFDQHGDKLTNPRRVQSAQKRPVVTLEFFADEKTKDVVVLVAGSSYPRIVRYRAATRVKGSADFRESNMLPLNPHVPVVEGWNVPYVDLVLFDFHLTNEKPPKTA